MDTATDGQKLAQGETGEKEQDPIMGTQSQDAEGRPLTTINGTCYVLDLWPAFYAYELRDRLLSRFGKDIVESLTAQVAQVVSSFEPDEFKKNGSPARYALIITVLQGVISGISEAGGVAATYRDVLSRGVYRMEDGKQIPVIDASKKEQPDFDKRYRGNLYEVDRLVMWVLWKNLGDFTQGLLSKGKAQS